MEKQELEEMIKKSPKGYFKTLKGKHSDFVQTLRGKYGDYPISQMCYSYIRDHAQIPKCDCGNDITFDGINKGYKKKCKSCYVHNHQHKSAKALELAKGAPSCNSSSCSSKTSFNNAHGKWNVYCSFKCRGIQNSLTSREKSKKTMLERHGVEHAMQSQKFIEKSKNTSMEKFGEDNVMKTDRGINAQRNSLFSTHGVDNPMFIAAGLNKDVIRELNCPITMQKLYDELGTKGICEKFGIQQPAVSRYMKQNGVKWTKTDSKFEKEVKTYVCSIYEGHVSCNERTVLNGKELDIYLSDIDFAIECNGTYWHSELQGKDKQYHSNKTNSCKEKGIRLLHIWEHDWNKKRPIFESLINVAINKIENRLYARKCELKEISSSEAKEFLEENHRQGSCPAKHRYGLYYNGDLVSIMTFGKSRFSNKYEYELLRLCTKVNTSVVGGASKMFKQFIKDVEPKSIGSYSDMSMNNGGIYDKLGFSHIHNSKPNYKYTRDYKFVENRVTYQKHKLPNKLDVFDKSLTEWQNMQMNGFDRIWDCGNSLWIWSA